MPAELATIPADERYGPFTGRRIARTRPRIYRKIIELLAAGVGPFEIARACRCSEGSVRAIERAQAETIGERKEAMAGLASRIARGAGEVIENDIAAGKIHGSAAVIAFGVGVDKFLSLSGEPTARIQIDLSASDLAHQFQQVTQAITAALNPPKPIHATIIDTECA